ncbi:MAG TPA: tetratricopeptide repeat protein, partial [Streptosporangiaceae bacterium]
PLYEQTLVGCERVLGPDHPSTLMSRGNLAHAYHAALRLADAIAVLERTVADCERVLGPDHPMTQTMRESLAAMSQG